MVRKDLSKVNLQDSDLRGVMVHDGKFDYSESWCNYPVLSSNGSKLYLSCTMDNLVREIDTETMQVIRSFPIEIPYDIIETSEKVA